MAITKENAHKFALLRKTLGKVGGRPKSEKTIAKIEQKVADDYFKQRILRAQDVLINAQLSLARGQQFLYKIGKTWIDTGAKSGYWKNETAVLVEDEKEIQSYLDELAENNGELSDNKNSGTTYYFITTKEPNNSAIDSMQNRVFGRAPDNINLNVNVDVSSLLRDVALRAIEKRKIRNIELVEPLQIEDKTS